MNIPNPAEYPSGVPNPYHGMVHVYPSYMHGGDWARPVFGFPYRVRPYNVLAGLGQAPPAPPENLRAPTPPPPPVGRPTPGFPTEKPDRTAFYVVLGVSAAALAGAILLSK